MRIGFYHDGAGTTHAGGIAIYTRQMAIELASSNQVYLYTQGGDLAPELIESEVHVIETPAFDYLEPSAVAGAVPFSPQNLSKLAMTTWMIRNGVIDHVDEHVDVLFTFQVLDDLLLSNLVDVPTVRGFLSDFDDVGIGGAIRERFTNTDRHVANTPYLADKVADEFGYEVDAVIPTGVNAELFHPAADPAFECDESAILFVGRLVESKGIFDLLEVIAGLEERVHLRVVGSGDEEKVRRRSRELGIADRVTVEGEVPHADLPGYYTAADVFCLPTHTENFGTVNLEAMACGTPVVTSDLEGIKTYLRPDEDGVVITPGDRDELAAALLALLTDPERRSAIGSEARQRAEAYDWATQAVLLERFCAAVLPTDGEREPIERPNDESIEQSR